MFSLRCLQSMTVHKCLSFFGRHSIGAAWLADASFHHPAHVYFSTFSLNSAFNAFGHLGKWYRYHWDRSINGISWSTSLNGSISSGTPCSRSSYCSYHCWRSSGISVSVYKARSLPGRFLGGDEPPGSVCSEFADFPC